MKSRCDSHIVTYLFHWITTVGRDIHVNALNSSRVDCTATGAPKLLWVKKYDFNKMYGKLLGTEWFVQGARSSFSITCKDYRLAIDWEGVRRPSIN